MASNWKDYPEDHYKMLAECRAYINAAPTPEERSKRKQQMYVHIYSSSQPLSTWLKDQKKDQVK
jgi:hypothetical protein